LTPEAAVFLAQARDCLDAAEKIGAAGIPRVATREAYMAAFHTAQAILFERTGQVHKTHGGVRAAFGLLAKDSPLLGGDLGRFLARSYNLKDIADYRSAPAIDMATAEAAIRDARTFVDRITIALDDRG
jgi:uncharacterized protein (UPF0332 family)